MFSFGRIVSTAVIVEEDESTLTKSKRLFQHVGEPSL